MIFLAYGGRGLLEEDKDMEGIRQERDFWLPFIHAAGHCTMLVRRATLLPP